MLPTVPATLDTSLTVSLHMRGWDVEPLFFRGSGISASDADFTII